MNNKVLITGAAGFIGSAVAFRLLNLGVEVTGIDNCNNYYSTNLKKSRVNRLSGFKDFRFIQMDIANYEEISGKISELMPSTIFHFAGQPGVRYSIDNPSSYIESNLVGFFNILESCRHCKIEHLIYASSSSVYGDGDKVPYSTEHETNHPLSLYAATKKANELMAHSYSHLYGIPMTGLRFFTVYGPWGRPDMALFKFTKSIIEDREITVFNNGNLTRDFTYIDDVVDACVAAMNKIPRISNGNLESESKSAPWKILNIGSDKPIALSHFISLIENALNKKAKLLNLPMQSGDVKVTHADIIESMTYLVWSPKIRLEDGIKKFVDWYIDYYQEVKIDQ